MGRLSAGSHALVGKLPRKSYLFKPRYGSCCDFLIFFGDAEHVGLRAQILHLGGMFARCGGSVEPVLGVIEDERYVPPPALLFPVSQRGQLPSPQMSNPWRER